MMQEGGGVIDWKQQSVILDLLDTIQDYQLAEEQSEVCYFRSLKNMNVATEILLNAKFRGNKRKAAPWGKVEAKHFGKTRDTTQEEFVCIPMRYQHEFLLPINIWGSFLPLKLCYSATW